MQHGQQYEIVLTIRMDQCLAEMLKHCPNRSAFVRDAIRRALARRCPACGGTGVVPEEDFNYLRTFPSTSSGYVSAEDASAKTG